MKNMRRYLWAGLLSLALIALGCNKIGSRSDAQVASDVQNKIFSDSNVPDKQITINSNKGVVTLSGTVSSEAARSAAATDAAQIDGVKTVVNNLEVAGATTAANNSPAQEPSPAETQSNQPNEQNTETSRATTTYPRRKTSPRKYSSANNGDNGLRTTVPQDTTTATNSSNSGNNVSSAATNPPPPPPPPPSKVTVPAGTQLSIRLNDEVNSEKAQVGDVFHGSISAPVTVDDLTAIPTTADVEGRVVDVKSAGRFAGGSVLTLQLTKLTMNGRSYSITTDQWTKSGSGKGKGTATKVGGGAAIGAVLGGIFGGGKGAAIGAAAGAGAGTAGSAVGKGHQIVLAPESVINFSLQNPITVAPTLSSKSSGQ
jgi:hypothetical protein